MAIIAVINRKIKSNLGSILLNLNTASVCNTEDECVVNSAEKALLMSERNGNFDSVVKN